MNLPPTSDIYMSILPPNIGHCCVVAKSCLTRDRMDCHPACFSVHGIFQGRILEWVAISYSGGPSQSRNQIHIPWNSCTGRYIIVTINKPILTHYY